MIVGVPLFAVIFAIIKTVLVTKLTKKDLPTETKEYVYVDYINTHNNEFVDLLPASVKYEQEKEKNRILRAERKAKSKNIFAGRKSSETADKNEDTLEFLESDKNLDNK